MSRHSSTVKTGLVGAGKGGLRVVDVEVEAEADSEAESGDPSSVSPAVLPDSDVAGTREALVAAELDELAVVGAWAV